MKKAFSSNQFFFFTRCEVIVVKRRLTAGYLQEAQLFFQRSEIGKYFFLHRAKKNELSEFRRKLSELWERGGATRAATFLIMPTDRNFSFSFLPPKILAIDQWGEIKGYHFRCFFLVMKKVFYFHQL